MLVEQQLVYSKYSNLHGIVGMEMRHYIVHRRSTYVVHKNGEPEPRKKGKGHIRNNKSIQEERVKEGRGLVPRLPSAAGI